MDIIFREQLRKYQDNAKKYKSKLKKYLLGGSPGIESLIAKSVAAHKFLPSHENIDAIKRKVSDFELKLDDFIKETERVYNLLPKVGDQGDDMINMREEAQEKIKKIISLTRKIVETHDFYRDVADEHPIDNDVLIVGDSNKIEEFVKTMPHIYETFIDNMKEFKAKLETDSADGNVFGHLLENILPELDEKNSAADNVVKMITDLNSRLEILIAKIKNVHGNFNVADVKLSTDDEKAAIETYTQGYNVGEPTEKITPMNFESFFGLSAVIKDCLDKSNEFVAQDEQTKMFMAHFDEIKLLFENIYRVNHYGGNINVPHDKTSKIDIRGTADDIHVILNLFANKITLMNTKLDEINIQMKKFQELIIEYKTSKIYRNNFVLFLLAATMSPELAKHINKYHYINKGHIQFYLSVVTRILTKIENKIDTLDIKYFKTYHTTTLGYMKDFLEFLIYKVKLNTEDIINIRACEGSTLSAFVILDYFKDITESYLEAWQKRVTIYARINDWDGKDPAKYVFGSDPTNARNLVVNLKNCSTIKESDTENAEFIKFTEVYDTENYKKPEVLTKYMSLETQISKKKGIMMITYGYSGTGKTFTLFGNSGVGQLGMLQATLANVRKLEEVRFRVYELYGFGVQYPHYWKGNVEQSIYYYNFEIAKGKGDKKGKKVIRIIDVPNRTDVNEFILSQDGFINIPSKDIYDIFKYFKDYVEEIDNKRREGNRIRITPNNPESSRSIIIYEFHLKVDGTYIPFIIVDLPGREEIVPTYVDSYLSKKFIPNEVKTSSFYKELLSAMSVNPLELSILIPTMIFSTFNEIEDIEDRRSIVDTVLPFESSDKINMDQWMKCTETLYPDMYKLKQQMMSGEIEKAGTFDKEILGPTIDGVARLNYIYNFNDESWSKFRLFNLIDNTHISSGTSAEFGETFQKKILAVRGANSVNPNDPIPRNSNQVDVRTNSIQYQGVLALFLINRLILMKRFNVIEKLYTNIVEKYLNMKKMRTNPPNILDLGIDDKRDFVNANSNLNVDGLTDQKKMDYYVDQVLYFRTYLAPYEGIFINENIMGLIKVLSKDIMEIKEDRVREFISEQPNKLGFENQKLSIRKNNYKLYPKNMQGNKNYENITRDDTLLDKMSEDNRGAYSSQKIFNYNDPFVKNIISLYKDDRSVEMGKQNFITIKKVSDFKIFYLFSNVNSDRKCEPQWKLLKNTLRFIETIDQ